MKTAINAERNGLALNGQTIRPSMISAGVPPQLGANPPSEVHLTTKADKETLKPKECEKPLKFNFI